MTPPTHDGIQIIGNTQNFLGGLRDRMIHWGLNDSTSGYEVVAILGSQSSGKSTLLNNLFQTNFAVMSPEVRGRTTNGVWLSRDPANDIIVMDVEGSDGASREDSKDFERKSALFALACSRLLVVNMWENQVGLYHGANMGLLKIIFEEYLALFGNLDQQAQRILRPKILFVIQAYSGCTRLTSLAQTIMTDLERMWGSATKPPELMNQTLADYFDFDFESVPHLVFAPDHYKRCVDSLRHRFVDREGGDYLFKRHPTTIPVNGLELYMRTTWEKIRLNQNLNLPGQHELLARLMCDRISTSLLEEFRPKAASQLAILNEGVVVDGLTPLIQDWRSDILGRFDEAAGRYVQPVYIEKRRSLLHSFQMEVSILLTGQIRNLRLSSLAAFDNLLRQEMEKEDSEFAAIVSNARDGYERDFIAEARTTATCLEDANLDWEIELEELRRGMVQLTKGFEQERRSKHPIHVSRITSIGQDKEITTRATLYRNGNLIVAVETLCSSMTRGLRGRVLVVVRDVDGNAIGVTNVLQCTTRGSIFDPFTPSDGTDSFFQHFPEDVGKKAATLDIYQQDGGSLGETRESIFQAGNVVAALTAQ